MNKSYKKRKMLLFLLFPLLVFGIGAIVMLLWNTILPALLGINYISYWQAVGLLVLCRILFGGLGWGNGKHHNYGEPPKNLRQKWTNMNAEEKALFKEQWKKRCANTNKE